MPKEIHLQGVLTFFENDGGFSPPDCFIGDESLEEKLMELAGMDGGSRGWIITDNYPRYFVEIRITSKGIVVPEEDRDEGS